VDVLRTALGDPTLTPASCPFDWLIAPLKSVRGLLQRSAFFPDTPAEIVIRQKPYWESANVYFWHDFGHALPEYAFTEVRQKYLHKAINLARACRSPHPLFLVSNTQNNLKIAVADVVGNFDPCVRASDLMSLAAELRTHLQRRFRLVLVTYHDRYVDDI